MDSGLRNWAIVGLVFVLGVLAAKAKEWLGNGIQQLGEQIYRRLAGSALLRKTALRRYTRELIKRHAKFVVSFRMDDPLRMDTGAVYVPLRGSLSGRHPLQEVAASIRAERLSLVHGVPGAGKTMLLKHEVLTWARGRCQEPAEPTEPSGKAWGRRQRRWRVDLKDIADIPVLLELHRLNGKSLTLHEHIVDHFARHGFPNADRWVTRALKAGELALYFDGLDEVATEQRPDVVESISRFAEDYENCRVVVTCRTAAYDGQFSTLFDQTLRVEDFDEHLIRRFLHGWPWPDGSAKDTVDHLLGALRDTPQLMVLARNPLLLTMIAYLYSYVYAETDQVLPHTRAEFYRQVTDHLLSDQRRRSRFAHPVKKAVLQHLALAAQDIPPATHDRLALPAKEVLKQVAAALADQGRPTDTAEAILDEIVERSGLLLAIDNGERYQFAHLTLQEYLSARLLAADPTGLLRRYRADPQIWRETVRLWCGVEAHDCTEVIRAVFATDPVLAFQCLADATIVAEDLVAEILTHFRHRLMQSQEMNHEVIAAFGLVAADRRPLGAGMFDFLWEQATGNRTEPASRDAMRALAATNTSRAADVLAPLLGSHADAAQALVSMGKLAVPAIARAVAAEVAEVAEAAAALWSIRSPLAAAILANSFWIQSPSSIECATLLANLLAVPEIEEELRSVPVPADAECLSWVWMPFARDWEDPLIALVGLIALPLRTGLISMLPNNLSPPDSRLLLALCMVEDSEFGDDEPLDPCFDDATLAAEIDSLVANGRGRMPATYAKGSRTVILDRIGRILETALDETPADAPNGYYQGLADLGIRVLRGARMTEWRARLLNDLPEETRLRAVTSLLSDGLMSPEGWARVRDRPRNPAYDFDKSWHYRGILLLAAAVSASAVGRAVLGLLGYHPWGPAWLSWLVLVQIVGGVILVAKGALTDPDKLFLYLLAPMVVTIELIDGNFDEDFWFGLAMLGMLPAVGLYWFVTLADFFGIAVAVSASGLVLSLAATLRWRGNRLRARARRASHSVHRLLFEAHAI